MKNKSIIIILIIVLSILTLSLTAFMFFILIKGTNINFIFNRKSEIIYEESYNIEDIEELKITTISSDINFKSSTDGKVKVIVYGDEYNDLKVNLDNSTLNIDYDLKNSFCLGFCYQNDRVIVYIPENFDKKLNITTTSGDTLGINLINANLDLVTVSGDVQINSINETNITTTSGEILINKVSDLKIKTISGDIEIDSITNKLNIETISGDIEINNLTLTNNSKIKTTSGDVEIDRTENVYIDTTTTSGDVKVKDNDRKAEYDLTIKTTSGDIEVNDY